MSEEIVLVDGLGDIEIVEAIGVSVEVLTEGIQGPPGASGRDATQYSVAAPFPISGHRVLAFDQSGAVQYASAKIASSCTRVIGLTLNAADTSGALSIALQGEVLEPSWNWTPNTPIWLADAGLLTQVEPSIANGFQYSLVIGFAITPTKIFVRIQPPLLLA